MNIWTYQYSFESTFTKQLTITMQTFNDKTINETFKEMRYVYDYFQFEMKCYCQQRDEYFIFL